MGTMFIIPSHSWNYVYYSGAMFIIPFHSWAMFIILGHSGNYVYHSEPFRSIPSSLGTMFIILGHSGAMFIILIHSELLGIFGLFVNYLIYVINYIQRDNCMISKYIDYVNIVKIYDFLIFKPSTNHVVNISEPFIISGGN